LPNPGGNLPLNAAVASLFTGFGGKFPANKNREFLMPYQGNGCRETGNVWRLICSDRVSGRDRGIGATEHTDGIDLALGDFGPAYPGGLFVAQDGENAPDNQNFKLAAWDDLRAALALP